MGPGVAWTIDLGKNWHRPKEPPRFEKHAGLSVKRIWHIRPGRPHEDGTLYLGVEPGALFVSRDGGETFQANRALVAHPTRSQWEPGAGGLCLHSIVLDPKNPKRMHVAISAAGVFRSEDGGDSWRPMNKNVRADFLPNKFPEVGQCAHKLVAHPERPDVLFQQNHCGTYRLDPGREEWTDICDGLPSRFGFPIAVPPHKPETIYVVPEESDEARMSPNGEFAVYRSDNSGRNWRKLTEGLPTKHAYLVVLREALSTDTFDPGGIYLGTNTGQIFYSRNDGTSWKLMADYLPPVLSVSAHII